MLPRCLVFCTLLLIPSLPGEVQPSPNLVCVGRNLSLTPGQTYHDAACILCSIDLDGYTTGSLRVFAGNVYLNGSVAGNVLVLGGNVTLGSKSAVAGRVIVFGGHLYRDPAAAGPYLTVLPPIIFLPLILIICTIIGSLIVLTRRMTHGPAAFPPLPRL